MADKWPRSKTASSGGHARYYIYFIIRGLFFSFFFIGPRTGSLPGGGSGLFFFLARRRWWRRLRPRGAGGRPLIPVIQPHSALSKGRRRSSPTPPHFFFSSPPRTASHLFPETKKEKRRTKRVRAGGRFPRVFNPLGFVVFQQVLLVIYTRLFLGLTRLA